MSILTKIFVVLVTVLSVGLVAMIVPFVYKTEKYQEKYNQEYQRRIQAEDSAALNSQALQGLNFANSEQARILREENTKLKTDVTRLQGDRANLESQLALERGNSTAVQAQLSRLSAAMSQQTDLNKILQAEVAERRTEGEKNKVALTELTGRNNELQTQNSVLERIVKRTAEELAALEQANSQLTQKLAEVPVEYRDRSSPKALPVEASTRIEGQVTQTRKIDTDTFVMVNVGKKDGVSENMKFFVHRGDKFLGTLIITNVDQKAASGRMVSLVQDIQSGDAVLSGN